MPEVNSIANRDDDKALIGAESTESVFDTGGRSESERERLFRRVRSGLKISPETAGASLFYNLSGISVYEKNILSPNITIIDLAAPGSGVVDISEHAIVTVSGILHSESPVLSLSETEHCVINVVHSENPTVTISHIEPYVIDFGQYVLVSSEETTGPLAKTVPEEVSLDMLLFYVRRLSVPYKEKIATRIEQLVDAIKREEDQISLSAESTRYFARFIEANQQLAAPDLVVSTRGNIRAEWHASWREHLAIEFLPDGRGRFVIFAPDPDLTAETMRFSGIVSVASLMDQLSPHGVLSWATVEWAQ